MHAELEECVANYVGKPAAIVTGMGFATNSAIIPVLIGKVYMLLHLEMNADVTPKNLCFSSLVGALYTGRVDN